jgi:hypothetical protein
MLCNSDGGKFPDELVGKLISSAVVSTANCCLNKFSCSRVYQTLFSPNIAFSYFNADYLCGITINLGDVLFIAPKI